MGKEVREIRGHFGPLTARFYRLCLARLWRENFKTLPKNLHRSVFDFDFEWEQPNIDPTTKSNLHDMHGPYKQAALYRVDEVDVAQETERN